MGMHDLKQYLAHENAKVVALCDVDAKRLATAGEMVPEAVLYADWRILLDKEKNNIDAVSITVPDHMHYAIAFRAIELGKHVYLQKPMCHDVAEVRKITEAAVEAGVITQLGTQHASSANDRRAVEMLKDGAIGKIKQAYLCSNRPNIEKYRREGPRPAVGQEPPEHLDWDLWIGTAPERQYAPEIYHPMVWRMWQDFGTGWSGDIGCHIFDAVWKGLDMKAPKSVMAEVQQSWKKSPERYADAWPQSNHITWQFPGTKYTEYDTLQVEWFDGEFYPPKEIQDLYPGDKYPVESAMLVGTEGSMLIVHGGSTALLPQEKFENYNAPVFEERNHYHHFVDACLGGENTESHFTQTGPMTEAILLGTVAIRVPDKLLQWDADKMKIPNYPEAEKLLSRTYRHGWETGGF
jgi:predicted dehydrogenase